MSKPISSIDILVPTYNASLWLNDCFKSILPEVSQFDFRIIVRDDSSQDDTLERLQDWKAQLGERILLLPKGPNLGMIGNYDAVFKASTAQWVLLADPDDVWMPGKMATTIEAMRAVECSVGSECPTAIFTDAEVVDASLHPVCDSYWKWMRQSPDQTLKMNRLLMDSPALTSTMAVNRALINIATPMSGAAIHPDWWLTLCACCFGKLAAVHQSTIRYRRHSANDSQVPSTSSLLHGLRTLGAAKARIRALAARSSQQARLFLERFGADTPQHLIPMLQAAAGLLESNFWQKRNQIIEYDLWFDSSIKNVGWIFLL